ncbi:Gfo/Idh/MocA family oxidoreductase [Paracidobacterium acidisoli]|uniref:Oxidoreductase n=1 Tax=Paracidobacterium acidisoli TaxID=2303751 RepID=A0A372IT32_9BACT|nr:Gfo/Idh/MocA family oxidoreductase [Paracidobacterium acidisoli]MBT9329473.1 Gfo/Idh/MocA family oxidoreductase [Paracidobacterium acidisoli]
MHEPVRVGVIGFGMAGRIFHTAVIAETPGLELAAIVQRTGDEAASTYPDARIFRSIDELLEDASIPFIVVATPSGAHFEHARQCLLAGRHVLIDKPFTLTSDEAAELIRLARERSLLLTAYQSRRWDGDFLTVREVLESGELERLVRFESHMDRFRAAPRLEAWRENGEAGGGILFDIGPHLIDQALKLFGAPESILAEVRTERESAVIDDAFDILLQYPALTVFLRSTLSTFTPGPRFALHGTKGSFVKFGIDPQENQLKAGLTFASPGFGEDPESDWGELRLADGDSRRLVTRRGDYRDLYGNVRDALLGKGELEVKPEQAWRTTRMIELARQSSAEGRRLPVDFSDQP